MTAAEIVLSPLRKDRITASRVAAVLGVDPYRKPEDVMREMVRQHFDAPEEFAGNFFTRWGKEHETDAIDAYEIQSENSVTHRGAEQLTVIHREWDFLAATPDGLVDDDGLVEAKCPHARYTHISDRPDYRAQVQHQLACTDREWGDFVIWRENAPLDVSLVMRDPDWLERHLPQLVTFRDEYQKICADPELAAPYIKPLVDVRSDADWIIATAEQIDLLLAAEAIDAQLEVGKKRLIELAGKETKVRGGGVLLYQTAARKPNINWKEFAAAEAPNADPEKYRPEPKDDAQPSWTVKRSDK